MNAQVTSASGAALPYFPVPANPIDFTSLPDTSSPLRHTGDRRFGLPVHLQHEQRQLTINQNTAQPLGITQATAIVSGRGYIYVLDNEAPMSPAPRDEPDSALYRGHRRRSAGQTGGVIPDDPTLSNPIVLLVESKGKFLYVANQGNNVQGTKLQSGYAGYVIDPSTQAAQLHRG